MATGDLRNNLKKLQAAIKSIKYEKDMDIESLSKGTPGAFLPIYHFAFIEYSRFIAEKISELNIELYGKADLRFIEAMYKVLRELFSYKPALTKDQFFSNGFAEKKIIMCTNILNQVRNMHLKLAPKPRPKTAPTNMISTIVSNLAASAANHKTQPIQAAVNKASKPQFHKAKDTTKPVVHNAAYSNIAQSNHATPPLISVQNEMNSQHIGNTAVCRTSDSSSECLPAKLNTVTAMLPSVEVHPDSRVPHAVALPQTYNPSAYAADDETHIQPRVQVEQQTVEVVSLHSDFSHDTYHTNFRPIDMIAKTPGKPLVAPHVVKHTGDAGQSVENLMSFIGQKLTNVAENVTQLVERIKHLEEKMNLLEVKPQQSPIPEQTLENILARLTLLENSFKLITTQVKPPTVVDEQSFADSSERPTVQKPRSTISEPNKRYIVQSFTDERNVLASPAMTSTPVELVRKNNDTSNKENTVPQAERIKAMLNETEGMLNMTVVSPICGQSVNSTDLNAVRQL